ncbi:DNA-binding response regulator [Beijerinckia sp. L45]|uniref:response regulator transcription factor n=1 Tax=Beijerinckia sp. L45 TaxID=1641855 RepID=UPI00131C62F3|nr:DNA-binding response regulator [Beijerinckia sp. L45]
MKRERGEDIVLVVDDSPDTVRLLTDVLDDAGMTVMVALDGAAAIKIAMRLRPDIVLMDAVMPGMDGFETCRQLKQLAGFDNVPVLFMTGLTEPEHSVRGFQAGGADYVTKPIVIEAMLARMGVHLTNARKIQSARMALDAADRFLVATDRNGEIRWFTPQAYRLLEQRFASGEPNELRLPDGVLSWVRARLETGQSTAAQPGGDLDFSQDGAQTRISFLGETERGEILLRIADASAQDPLAMIKLRYGLTQREAEVLSWIARGKSNRDIAAILSLSPRTVDKHLEIIFNKLQVENRTAAAALILRSGAS